MALNLPFVIANDTPADANEVMSNFLAIRQYVNQEMLPKDGSVAMTGRLLLSADPTAANHAANKKYVDDSTADGFVTTVKLATGAVTTVKLEDASNASTGVTNVKLRHSAASSVIGRSATSAGAPADIVVAANRVLGRGNTGGLGSVQVQQAMIANGAVGTAQIADNAVTAAKIGANQVTNSEIAGSTILAGNIANGAVTEAKVNADVRAARPCTGARVLDNTASGSVTITLPASVGGLSFVGATGVFLSVTAIPDGGTAPGFATVFPASGGVPDISNVNWSTGGPVANGFAFVALDGNRSFRLWRSVSCRILLDVQGATFR